MYILLRVDSGCIYFMPAHIKRFAAMGRNVSWEFSFRENEEAHLITCSSYESLIMGWRFWMPSFWVGKKKWYFLSAKLELVPIISFKYKERKHLLDGLLSQNYFLLVIIIYVIFWILYYQLTYSLTRTVLGTGEMYDESVKWSLYASRYLPPRSRGKLTVFCSDL